MKFLLIDTTADRLLVATENDKKTVYEFGNGDKGSTSRAIIPTISRVLDRSGFSINEVDCVFAVVGPGSFTGIRIGVCTAESIAFGIDKPTCSLTVFDGFGYDGLCVIPSRRGYCYYSQNGEFGEKSVEEIEQEKDLRYRLFDFPVGEAVSDEDYVANLFEVAGKKYNDKNFTSLEPMYLKQSQAERMRKEKK